MSCQLSSDTVLIVFEFVIIQKIMTLDITIEKAQLKLNSQSPERLTSYVKLKAGGRQCHTVLSHGPNPVWSRQTFRSTPQDKLLFQVCLPSGSVPQPHTDRVHGRGVFDFRLFASKSQLQDMDDTNEIEAKVPLESPEIRGMEVGSLTLRLKYIIGKMHIGGLHPFSQMDLTFENMTSKIYEGGAYQQSNLKGSQNQGTPQSQLQQTPPSQVRSPQSNLGSNRDPSRISQFNTGNQNIPYQATQIGPYPMQSSQGPAQSSNVVQKTVTTTQIIRQNPVPYGTQQQATVVTTVSRGVNSDMRQPWTLMKSFAQKNNIFSILDSGGKPFELAPGRIRGDLSKSNMANYL